MEFYIKLGNKGRPEGLPILDFERWAQCLSPVLGHQPLRGIAIHRGRWPGLSAEPNVTFSVRLLLISLPPSREYKAESTLWG